MKTNTEIQQEAQHMIEQGRTYREEMRLVAANRELTPLPRVLVRLPESVVTIRPEDALAIGAVHSVHRQRHIEAAIDRGELVYRLIAMETERDSDGRILREGPPALEMESRTGFDLLHAGYEQAEAERLSEAIFSFDEGRNEGEPQSRDAVVAQVEDILETGSLIASDRLRAKAEIMQFFDGRLETSAFISQAIDRQCAREDNAERRAERCDRRITMENP